MTKNAQHIFHTHHTHHYDRSTLKYLCCDVVEKSTLRYIRGKIEAKREILLLFIAGRYNTHEMYLFTMTGHLVGVIIHISRYCGSRNCIIFTISRISRTFLCLIVLAMISQTDLSSRISRKRHVTTRDIPIPRTGELLVNFAN